MVSTTAPRGQRKRKPNTAPKNESEENTMNTEKWIINTTTCTAYSFTDTDEKATAKLLEATQYEKESAELCERHAKNYPERAEYWQKQAEAHRAAKFEIMSYEEFQKREREKLLAGDPIEETAEEYNYALDVLPPVHWVTIDGVSEFCMSERYTGTYTTQHAHDKRTNKYYCKTVDMCDKSTWIHNYIR